MEIQYLTRLELTPIPRDTAIPHLKDDTDKMRLLQHFLIEVKHEGKQCHIRVPSGYVTDGASIPKFFHRLYHPFTTESMWAAAVHDWIYSHDHKTFSKGFADKLLRAMIAKDGGSKFMQWAFYKAVRINYKGGNWIR